MNYKDYLKKHRDQCKHYCDEKGEPYDTYPTIEEIRNIDGVKWRSLTIKS